MKAFTFFLVIIFTVFPFLRARRSFSFKQVIFGNFFSNTYSLRAEEFFFIRIGQADLLLSNSENTKTFWFCTYCIPFRQLFTPLTDEEVMLLSKMQKIISLSNKNGNRRGPHKSIILFHA